MVLNLQVFVLYSYPNIVENSGYVNSLGRAAQKKN